MLHVGRIGTMNHCFYDEINFLLLYFVPQWQTGMIHRVTWKMFDQTLPTCRFYNIFVVTRISRVKKMRSLFKFVFRHVNIQSLNKSWYRTKAEWIREAFKLLKNYEQDTRMYYIAGLWLTLRAQWDIIIIIIRLKEKKKKKEKEKIEKKEETRRKRTWIKKVLEYFHLISQWIKRIKQYDEIKC